MADNDTIYEKPEELMTHEGGFLDKRKVNKPWGHEMLLVATPKYVMKLLFIKAGERLSIQYHEKKLETLYCEKGEGHAFLGNKEDPEGLKTMPFNEGDVLHITPGMVHTYEAISDLTLIECSTPEIDDVVRIKDRYGRA